MADWKTGPRTVLENIAAAPGNNQLFQISEMAATGDSTTSATTPRQLQHINNLTPMHMVELDQKPPKMQTDLAPSRIKDVHTSDLPQEIKEEVVKVEEDISDEVTDVDPVIDIMINNVVSSFSVSCHLDLRNIARTGNNVEFRRENGMVTMKIRRPPTTASIWSSGKITCTGSTSEIQAKTAARRVARAIQKLGYNAKFKNFRIVNVLGTCTMPFAVKITPFSQKFRNRASYEPELHPGVTYKIDHPKATLKIFSTGSITVTAPSVNNVQSAIEHIYPLVNEFGKARTEEEMAEYWHLKARRQLLHDDGHDSDSDIPADLWN
ncbi:TATA box-binding protein-like 1 isoform X2 [Procambarus clarkii]|uniref:TATA box-binding protein-like 1 isoform X2 n=1 Tax=Procambarus clarkii TaxID=6728 RepID=UPI001E67199F|nr:TATA box-binding protein-like 1 isoform X2 [Procambarus clarkii]